MENTCFWSILIPPLEKPIRKFTVEFVVELKEPRMTMGEVLVKEDPQPGFHVIIIVVWSIMIW